MDRQELTLLFGSYYENSVTNYIIIIIDLCPCLENYEYVLFTIFFQLCYSARS